MYCYVFWMSLLAWNASENVIVCMCVFDWQYVSKISHVQWMDFTETLRMSSPQCTAWFTPQLIKLIKNKNFCDIIFLYHCSFFFTYVFWLDSFPHRVQVCLKLVIQAIQSYKGCWFHFTLFVLTVILSWWIYFSFLQVIWYLSSSNFA